MKKTDPAPPDPVEREDPGIFVESGWNASGEIVGWQLSVFPFEMNCTLHRRVLAFRGTPDVALVRIAEVRQFSLSPQIRNGIDS